MAQHRRAIVVAGLFAVIITTPVVRAECVPPRQIVARGKPNFRWSHVTERVLANQLAMGHITREQVDNPALAGYVGVVDCAMIGQYVGITWPGGVEAWPYLVIDCRNPNLPALPEDDPWIAAAEFDRDVWMQHYTWRLFAEKAPVVVWQYAWEDRPCGVR